MSKISGSQRNKEKFSIFPHSRIEVKEEAERERINPIQFFPSSFAFAGSL